MVEELRQIQAMSWNAVKVLETAISHVDHIASLKVGTEYFRIDGVSYMTAVGSLGLMPNGKFSPSKMCIWGRSVGLFGIADRYLRGYNISKSAKRIERISNSFLEGINDRDTMARRRDWMLGLLRNALAEIPEGPPRITSFPIKKIMEEARS